ncbi:hypothetical protein K9M59_00930 [Candidatus Gracilibacteria bacterium]|nr:hypothetical protein [Candidatus Gracilibacteria bacterium]MCF7819137.1 hypothetical protein [Candidatus Gracilibacteria bacterium]
MIEEETTQSEEFGNVMSETAMLESWILQEIASQNQGRIAFRNPEEVELFRKFQNDLVERLNILGYEIRLQADRDPQKAELEFHRKNPETGFREAE